MITCTNQLACAGGSPNIFECIDDKGNIVSEPETFAWVDTFDYCCHGGGNCADGCFDQQNGGRNGGKGGNGKSPA